MTFGQNMRLLGAKVRQSFRFGQKPAETPSPDHVAPAEDSAEVAETPKKKRPLWVWAILAFIAILPLYYSVGSILAHRINDDLGFTPEPAKDANGADVLGGSQAVAAMAQLIDREVNTTTWAPNTQWFEPAALLRYGGNMVNFQSGMLRAFATFSLELEGRLGRLRGTSSSDADLLTAREKLAFSPQSWALVPLIPGGADNEYRHAAEALTKYNERLAAHGAVFEARADNLQAVLDRIALDIGSSSEDLGQQIIAGRSVFIDRRADKLFYFTKGQAYAYYEVLSGLKKDFGPLLEQRRVAGLYDDMLAELGRAAALEPIIVQNASPDAALIPNHLAMEGYYLMKARARLREITDVLQR